MWKVIFGLLIVVLLVSFVGCNSEERAEARRRTQAEGQLAAIEEIAARDNPRWEAERAQLERDQPQVVADSRESNIQDLMNFNAILERAISDDPLERLLADAEPFDDDS